MPRHLLSLSDLDSPGLTAMLDSADRWKRLRGSVAAPRPLDGKSIALLFEKASTRTHTSLEVAVHELGGHPLLLTASGSQMGRGEPMADAARVFSRMVHGVTFRTFSHARLTELAMHSTVPVLNALTDAGHPMQLLADLQTIRQERGRLEGLRYAWVGDGNNMANSWIEAAGLLGLELRLACPEGYEPEAEGIALAKQRGGSIELVRDPAQAVRDADVISADVFTSMGQEGERERRLEDFKGYCINRQLLSHASREVIVLHCLPAHRGEEIEAEVLEGPHSRVWDQAEARLHTAKAALEWAVAGND